MFIKLIEIDKELLKTIPINYTLSKDMGFLTLHGRKRNSHIKLQRNGSRLLINPVQLDKAIKSLSE